MKRYVWGFPGIGKSSLRVPGLNVVDADCELFKFLDVAETDLHSSAGDRFFEPNGDYPQNYLDYIRSVEAEIVLLNCHLTLLDGLNKDDVLIVYPCKDLAEEYMARYQKRGDSSSFSMHMMQEWDGLVQYIEASNFDRYQVFSRDTYLSDLFERKDFKMKIMTRQDIINALERAMTLKVIDTNEERGELVCSLEFVADVPSEHRINDAAVWAEAVLEGTYSLDIDQLSKVCAAREDELRKERETLVAHFQRAIDLSVLNVDVASKTIVGDLSFAADEVTSGELYDAHDLADDVMSGKYAVDIVGLKTVCEQREEQLVEMQYTDRRGGLSREELADKIMQGIVNGALGILYGEISPYSYGYEVTFGGDGVPGSTRNFKNRWECYNGGFFDVPGKIVRYIENNRQDAQAFGANPQPLDINELIAAIDEMEDKQITRFVPEKETNFKRWDWPYSTGSVATVMDVHAGKGLDGIVQRHYHGTYSTMTPARENELVDTLVFMKGFCLDYLNTLDVGPDGRRKVVEYLKKRGIDISSPEKLQAWIKENPEKCAREENRRVFELKKQKELYGRAYKDVVELNSLVNDFKGSLEDLCIKLGGQNFDGTLFDVNYGVVAATIELEGDKIALNQASVDIWDDAAGRIFDECISVRELKTVCKQYDIDVGEKLTFDREGYMFNDEQKLYAQAYCDFVELKAVVGDYAHSFDKLCDRLGGDRFNDNSFRLDYGVIAVSIDLFDGEVFLNESIGVYDRAHEDFVDNFGSFNRLKEVCEEIGFDVNKLEEEALTVLHTEKPSLSAQIEAGVSLAGGKGSDKDVDIDRRDER